ncbi:hypothetical protein [Geodermatophilus nigrescens]|uniref:Uncharacterized protein n=1 Tax=Geodermatophilus nigrescens TaxID=1070870 RepID=A0A1M5ET69_9ACTN|nr:hypothetical protein [Geodermatophilus nigrescens]SHF82435.1 hypothetical protein SAMN05444351_0926 [Geodermatophilus nigrescens]
MSHSAARLAAVTVGASAVLLGLAAPALAAPPTIERVQVDETFADEFLSEECGVDVTTTVVGHVTFRTFGRDGTGPTVLTTVNLSITATAGDNTIRFRNVGADLERRTSDGDLILSVIGQVPFDFNGVFKINLTTGEWVHVPGALRPDDLAEACAILTA